MKKLQNLKEWQIVGTFSALGVSVVYASIVAIFAHTLDLLPVMTLCLVLVSVTAVAVGVVVGMVKDEHATRVNYYATKRANSLRDDVANRDAEIALLQDELADSLYREKNATNNLASARETLNTNNAHYRASLARIEVLLAKVREQEFTRLQLSKVNDKLNAQIDEQEQEIDALAQSRNDWRNAYDKLRNGDTNYTHSASTALLVGTLDKAYKVDGETRYPLA